MKEQKDLDSKNLENYDKSKIIFDNGDYFILCNGKIYKIINDTAIEIITTKSQGKN